MIVQEILMGTALGLLTGLTGAGGAALALPGMIYLLGLPTVIAVATTFPFTAIMKVFGSVQHVWQGSIHWRTTAELLVASFPGTLAGIFLTSSLLQRYGDAFNDWLKLAIGLLLVGSATASFLAKRAGDAGSRKERRATRRYDGMIAGALCGVVIGATSVGGGSLLIVVMLMIYDISPAKIVGSSIAVSLVLMVLGTAAFWQQGLADLTLAWHLTIGGVPGVILGSSLTLRMSPVLLERAVALAILVSGVSLAIQGGLSLSGA